MCVGNFKRDGQVGGLQYSALVTRREEEGERPGTSSDLPVVCVFTFVNIKCFFFLAFPVLAKCDRM